MGMYFGKICFQTHAGKGVFARITLAGVYMLQGLVHSRLLAFGLKQAKQLM
jgi:hypothetical protein